MQLTIKPKYCSKNKINYNSTKPRNISFEGGLPDSFVKYVNQLNISAVENKLNQKGIATDFNGSKVVAACTEKTVDIFEKYNLALPKRVEFVPIEEKNVLARAVSANCIVKINSKRKEFQDILSLNKLEERQESFHPTDHFLATFIHEFAHSAHFQNVSKKTNDNKAVNIFHTLRYNQMRPFLTKVQKKGKYSNKNLIEYIAESITKNIIENLDDNLGFKAKPELGIFEDKTIELNDFIIDKSIKNAIKATNKAIWDGDTQFLAKNGYGIKGQISSQDIIATTQTIIGTLEKAITIIPQPGEAVIGKEIGKVLAYGNELIVKKMINAIKRIIFPPL